MVVDEAHLLDREMLEEVRFLLNFKMDAVSPMALILVGQTELWEKLQMQSYTAIRQRIDIQCKIQPMDHSQVKQYLKRHLEYAGSDRDIFSDDAIEMVYRYSGGSARLINKVCTSSLIYGCQNGKRIIDDHMIKLVIEGEYRTAINLMVKARILVGLNKEQASNHLTEIQSNCLMLVLY